MSVNQKHAEVHSITKKYLNELTAVWSTMFSPSMCADNFDRLIRHVNNFYNDLLVETLGKKTSIEHEIVKLKREASDLSRKLNVSVHLPETDEQVPLLEQRTEIDEKLENLREMLRQRQQQIRDLLLQQETLCEELGESPLSLIDDPLPTESELAKFQANINHLKTVRVERKSRLSALRIDIENYMEILGYKEDHYNLLSYNAPHQLHESHLAEVLRLHQSYTEQVQHLYEHIDSQKRKLETLWERLGTPNEIRDKYRAYENYNHETLKQLNEEVKRCEELKSQNIKQYIEQIREEICEWWSKTLTSESERARFSNFHNNCYSDDLLELHEMELEQLKNYYSCNIDIFKLINMRTQLWERMLALEQKANDPQRFNNRGGQLLKEEKERKLLTNKLPKIEEEIKQLVEGYEEREKKPFLVYGENIIDYMANEWEKKKQEKEAQTTSRKNPLTPKNIKTQMQLQKNSSKSAIRSKTPVTMSLSVKPKTTSSKHKLSTVNEVTVNRLRVRRSLMSNLKSKRVIGSMRPVISNKMRRSSKYKVPRAIPTIRIQQESTEDENDVDDNATTSYVSFEPAARSSILQDTTNSASATNSSPAHLRHLNERDLALIKELPKPRMPKPKGTPTRPKIGNSANTEGSNKLSTKNLPILI